MKTIIIILLLLTITIPSFPQSQKKRTEDSYLVLVQDAKTDKYGYANTKGKIIIPMGKYPYCFTDTLRHFAVVQIRNRKGLWAIDRNEKPLFEVYIFDNGPDDFYEGLMRVVKDKKIGFANTKGQIVIQPQFDMASPFENGYSIIGENCKKEPAAPGDDEHFSTVCQKYGYINKKGKIIKFGNYSIDEIQAEINK